jgi:hypothetical protein
MMFPRLQFTVRQLMTALGVVALLLTVWRFHCLSRIYHEKVEWFDKNAGHSRRLSSEYAERAKREREIWPDRSSVTNSYLSQSERHRRRSEYFAASSRRYARAAARPWVPLAPDPPAPPELTIEP